MTTTKVKKELQYRYWQRFASRWAKYEASKNVHINMPPSSSKADYFIEVYLGDTDAHFRVAANTQRGKERIAVGLWIPENVRLYDTLNERREEIEAEIGFDRKQNQGFVWVREPKNCRVWLRRYCESIENEDQWSKYIRWQCEKLEAFIKSLAPRINT
jgi:hypothetical protein